MFRRIYVPIDNSDVSDKVLKEAIKLAQSLNAELRISHVVNLEQVTFGIEMVGVSELKEALLGIANKLLDHVRKTIKVANVKAEVHLIENYGSDLVPLLIDDLSKWRADLIVLGSHHLGSFTHFVVGGVVEDLANETEVPILLVTKHKQLT